MIAIYGFIGCRRDWILSHSFSSCSGPGLISSWAWGVLTEFFR